MKEAHRKFAADIERVAREVAVKHGCEVVTVDGQAVMLCEYLDGFEVALAARGVRGRQYIATAFDVDSASLDQPALDQLLTMELDRAAKRTVSIAAIPREIPVLEHGCTCLVHRPDFDDEEKPWPRVTTLDFVRWEYACNVDPKRLTWHRMPDAIAYAPVDTYTVRRATGIAAIVPREGTV